MNINVLPRDPLLCVFGYLDVKDLTNLRAVNKRLKLYIEQSLEKNWPDALKVMNKWKEVILARPQESNKGLFDKFVNWINFKSGVLSIITSIFCLLFPSIKKEIDARNKFVDLQEEFKIVKTEYIIQNKKMSSLQKMMSLFGGKESFEDLPVLDIGEPVGQTDYIDFITPEEMTAPIMRGRDCYGRVFFTIRFETTYPNIRACQTFFEMSNDTQAWSSGSLDFAFSRFGGYLIDEDGKVNEHVFKQLATAIKEGRNGDLTIV